MNGNLTANPDGIIGIITPGKKQLQKLQVFLTALLTELMQQEEGLGPQQLPVIYLTLQDQV
jgi:hypothetical protein